MSTMPIPARWWRCAQATAWWNVPHVVGSSAFAGRPVFGSTGGFVQGFSGRPVGFQYQATHCGRSASSAGTCPGSVG